MKLKRMTLDEVKQAELDLLLYFDKVCRENGIEYTITYGTLLGAVRHKGFIPWDDDIDVCVPLEQYDSLLKLLEKSDRCRLRHDGNDASYYYDFAKLVDPTTITRERNRPRDDAMGVWIDIFPILGLPEEDPGEEFFDRFDRANSNVFDSIKYYYMLHASKLRIPLKCVLRLPRAIRLKRKGTAYWKERRRALYHACPTASAAFWCVGPSKTSRSTQTYPKEWFDRFVDIEFEGHTVRAIAEWDKFLTRTYGDYMTPPPEDQRIPSHFKAYRK